MASNDERSKGVNNIKVIDIPNPEGHNLILGHSHFIKTVEDLYEVLVESSPFIKFGIAFCEASAKRLIRSDGNDVALVKHAERIASIVRAGHFFVIVIKDAYPINVLNRIKHVSEVVRIFAASANPLKLIVADVGEGRAILGVVDGSISVGIESLAEQEERRNLLRKLGYKR